MKLTYQGAMEALNLGMKVKLPEWGGYWFKDGDKIMVFTKDGDIVDSPWIDKYKQRDDWLLTDGRMGFDFAIRALKNGKPVARAGWNGKGMFIYLNQGSVPESIPSKEGQECPLVDSIRQDLFVLHDSGTTVRLPNINMKSASGATVTGWLASQTDMLAEDWILVK